MKPTVAELEERDLLDVARGIAKAHHLTLEEMLSSTRTAQVVAARRGFYGYLSACGWSNVSIAKLVGRDRTCIDNALSPPCDTIRAARKVRRAMAAPKADAGHKARVASSLDWAAGEFASTFEKLARS